jgi:gliding motility-associated-like protein
MALPQNQRPVLFTFNVYFKQKMAFITFLRIPITFFLFLICLQFNIQAQLPLCKDSFPASLLPNNSFEQYSGCNEEIADMEGGVIDVSPNYGGITVNAWHIFRRNWNVYYYNYNCKSNRASSIFDPNSFSVNASYDPKVPLPLPDSTGFIAIDQYNGTNDIGSVVTIHKTYITTCLSEPLYPQQPYVFSFYLGFGLQKETNPANPHASPSPFGIAIFGRYDCPDYPLNDTSAAGCLSQHPGWVELGKVKMRGQNSWVQGVIEFTPQTKISCIGIGPDCSENSYIMNTQAMYYMDKFVLAPKADFSFKTITALSGNPCTGNFVLKAPTHPAATYQWYKDGVVIANATSQVYTVPGTPEAAGDYAATISLPYNACVNTLPYTVAFSDVNKLSLGNDTILCAPAQIELNARWHNGRQYLWQDGSRSALLTVNKTGDYSVQVKDENGCIKKDTIKVKIQGCEECEMYIPSAFTPNNDGLNDVFRALPKCANIGFQHFIMRIYNRWGQIVFASSDVHKGWDGTYKGNSLDTGTYIYYIDYAFKQNKPLSQKGTIQLIR